MIFNILIRKYQLRKLNKKFQKVNKNSDVYLEREIDIDLIKVGRYTYGTIYALTFNNESKLIIGNYVSIAPNVAFMLSADHFTDHISSFPFKVKVLGEKLEAFSKGDIVIQDDVWIGYGATILSGVTIGQGAVIAAGAVVSKNVPPYAVVGGVPAKIIKYRFSADMIKELLKIDYSKLTKEMIIQHENELYTKLTEVKQLEWMPKK